MSYRDINNLRHSVVMNIVWMPVTCKRKDRTRKHRQQGPSKIKEGWLKHGAHNAKVGDLIPVWAIHSRAGIDDSSGSLTTQNIL